MSIAFRITLIIVSVFTLLYMCKKVKQEKLQIEYSIFWTLFAIMLVLFSIFPQIADWMSELVGVYSTTNFIFLLIIFILLVKCFQLTMDISKLDNKVKELVQKAMRSRRKIAKHACMNEQFFRSFIWRKATSR